MASVCGVRAVAGLLVAVVVTAVWGGAPVASAAPSGTTKPTTAPAAVASATGCADVLFVGVRGSGQNESDFAGYGREVALVRDRVKERVAGAGLSFAAERVDYTAAPVGVMVPKHWDDPTVAPFEATVGFARYMESVRDGVTKVRERLLAAESDCGATEQKIVLAGYSQGAMAVHRALRQFGDDGRNDILNRVVAVGMVANPDRPTNSSAVRFGTSPGADQGVANRFATDKRDVPDSVLAHTASLCDDGDIVCDFALSSIRPRGGRIHTSYGKPVLRKIGDQLGAWAAFGVTPPPTDPVRDSTVQPFTYAEEVSPPRVWPATDGWWLSAYTPTDTDWYYRWISPTGVAGPHWYAPYDPASVVAVPGGDMLILGVDRRGDNTFHLVRVGPDGPILDKVVPTANPNTFHSIGMGRDGHLYWLGVFTDGSWLNQIDPTTLEFLHRRGYGNAHVGMVGLPDRLVLGNSGTVSIPYSEFSTATDGTPLVAESHPSLLQHNSDWERSLGLDGSWADITTWPTDCADVSLSYLRPDGTGWVRTMSGLGITSEWNCEVTEIDARPDGGAVITLTKSQRIILAWLDADGNLVREQELGADGLSATTVLDPAGVAYTSYTHPYTCPAPYSVYDRCSDVQVVRSDTSGNVTARTLGGDMSVSMAWNQGPGGGVPMLTTGLNQVLTVVGASNPDSGGAIQYRTVTFPTTPSPRQSFTDW